MDRIASKFDSQEMRFRSVMAQKRVNDTIKRAKAIEADDDKENRLKRQLCKACHYFPALAGRAFTTQPCASCHTPETYSSTNTDALCMPCAQDGGLCKHCRGDIDMNAARQDWPNGKVTTSTDTKETD